MDHLVSLSIEATAGDDFVQVHQDLSELARNYGDSRYVSVSASRPGEPDELDDPGCGHEQLTYGEHTLEKVKKALGEALRYPTTAPTYQLVEWCINEMQNAGILFRERFDAEDLT